MRGTNEKRSWLKLENTILARLNTITGTKDTSLLDGKINPITLKVSADNVSTKKDLLESKQDYYLLAKTESYPKVFCTKKKNVGKLKSPAEPALKVETLDILLQAYKNACYNYIDAVDAENKVINGFKGLISDARNETRNLEEAKGITKAAMAKADAEYKEANKKFKDTQKALEGKDFDKQLNDLNVKLEKLEKLEKLPDLLANLIGKEKVKKFQLQGKLQAFEEKRKSLSDLLEVISSGTDTNKPETPKGKQILNKVASQFKNLASVINKNQYPSLNALLLEKEHLRLNIESLKNGQKSFNRQIVLSGKKYEGLRVEAFYLKKTLQRINDIKTKRPTTCYHRLAVPKTPASSLVVDYEKSGITCKKLIRKTLGSFTNAWTFGRLAYEDANYRIIAEPHQAILDSTEIALAQWENLIGVPLAQLVEFHGSGIKSENIAKLISAAGLGAIAGGVN